MRLSSCTPNLSGNASPTRILHARRRLPPPVLLLPPFLFPATTAAGSRAPFAGNLEWRLKIEWILGSLRQKEYRRNDDIDVSVGRNIASENVADACSRFGYKRRICRSASLSCPRPARGHRPLAHARDSPNAPESAAQVICQDVADQFNRGGQFELGEQPRPIGFDGIGAQKQFVGDLGY